MFLLTVVTLALIFSSRVSGADILDKVDVGIPIPLCCAIEQIEALVQLSKAVVEPLIYMDDVTFEEYIKLRYSTLPYEEIFKQLSHSKLILSLYIVDNDDYEDYSSGEFQSGQLSRIQSHLAVATNERIPPKAERKTSD